MSDGASMRPEGSGPRVSGLSKRVCGVLRPGCVTGECRSGIGYEYPDLESFCRRLVLFPGATADQVQAGNPSLKRDKAKSKAPFCSGQGRVRNNTTFAILAKDRRFKGFCDLITSFPIFFIEL